GRARGQARPRRDVAAVDEGRPRLLAVVASGRRGRRPNVKEKSFAGSPAGAKAWGGDWGAPAPPAPWAGGSAPRSGAPARGVAMRDRIGPAPMHRGSAMRIAAIDLGSNSIHMIVVEVGASGVFRVIEKEREMVRLGALTLSRRLLSAAAMKRGLEVVSKYKRLAANHRGEQIIALATPPG